MTGLNRYITPLKMPVELWQSRTPGQVIVQITERCNASCPQCGMNINNSDPRADLPLDRIKSIIDSAAVKGVQVISFTGGEPLLRLKELVDMINYAGAAGMKYIRTGTNGFFMARPDRPGFEKRVGRVAEALAATPLRNFWISLDSADPETHERMRGLPGLVKGLAKAMPIFHAHGIYPAANLGFNRNLSGPATAGLKPDQALGLNRYLARFKRVFTEGLKVFYRRVLDLGFTMSSTCYPMSLDESCGRDGLEAVYGASSVDSVIRFNRLEKAAIFQVIMDVVPSFRPHLRIFSPLSSLLALKRQYRGLEQGPVEARPCRGGLDNFFVNAKAGHAFPCGYRGGDDLGPFEDLDLDRLDRSAICRRCDWECFRDPSELFGPLLLAARHPLATFSKMAKDREYRRAWLADLSYYRACALFDGRRPPDYDRLSRYSGFLEQQTALS